MVEAIDGEVGTRMTARLPIHAALTAEPLDVDRHRLMAGGAAAGALVTFVGQVRNHDGGRGVRLLEYSAHPVAVTVLRGIATVAGAAEGVRGIAVSHRVGELAVGDVALCCVVAADHRRQAFDACGELVEEVKRLLPVWKRQCFTDGSEGWVGSA